MSFLIVWNNPVHVDVHVDIDSYLNCKFYNQNFE